MNFEKFSERARGFVQAAQTIAIRENHQRFLPEHLLKALLDDDQGLAANLIKRAGGDPGQARSAVEAALAKVPRVEGGGDQLYMDGQTAKVLAEAEKLAQQAGDSFVTVERLLTALAVTKSGANDALKSAGVTAQGLNAAMAPVEVTAETLALDAIREVGPGGHFFGAAHTMGRYATEFYTPLLSDWSNFGAWEAAGRRDALTRAHGLARVLEEAWEPPPLDPGRAEAMEAFVARRTAEGGAQDA